MARKALVLMIDKLGKQEQDAAKQLAQAQAQLQQYQAQLDHLYEYRRNYLEQSMRKGNDGVHAQSFHQYQVFIQKLDQASEQQRKLIEQLRNNVNHSRRQWQKIRAQKSAMQTLIEKQAQAEIVRQGKVEQKMLDEHALFQFYRNNSPL